MKSMIAKALLVAVAAAAGLACTNAPIQGPALEEGQAAGTVGMRLQLAPGVQINTVNWTIHNPTLLGTDLTGSVDVSQSETIQFVVGGLPAGSGYSITLTAVTEGATVLHCMGSASFTIVANATSPVAINLVCSGGMVDAGNNGSVLINGTTTIAPSCAAITGLSASPSTADVGGIISLAATGIDSGGTGSTVGFLWTVTGSGAGSFSSTTSATPTFTCTSPGVATVTVTASLPGGATCTNNTSSVDLTCSGVVTASDSGSAIDTGTAVPDTGVAEASLPDTGTPDAGQPDTGLDAGAPDTGLAADTGSPDSGDTGIADAGPGDAESGAVDSGAGDADASEGGGGNLCDPSNPAATTLGCLQQQDKSTSASANKCSTCVVSNSCFDPLFQGGTCETTLGNATLFAGALPDGKTCAQVFSPLTAPVKETAVCLDVLNTVFMSKCAASLQETPCVCGTVDIASCNAGTVTPNGAGFDSFACDFDTTSTSVINTDFTVQTFGAGQANALIQCAAAFGCECF